MNVQLAKAIWSQKEKETVLPNCLIVGPQRAGTTWQHQYLEAHPDVSVAQGIKETRFFDVHYDKGIDWYASHFKHASQATCVVEVAPTYFHDDLARERIRERLGVIPIICTLRNPVKRAFSLYLLLRHYGLTRKPFREAIEEAPLLKGSICYGTHVQRWIQLMGEERVHVLFLEDLARDPQEYAVKLCDVLGISRQPVDAKQMGSPNPIESVPFNPRMASFGTKVADWARGRRLYSVVQTCKRMGLGTLFYGRAGTSERVTISREDEKWFTELIMPEIELLERVLGLDLSHWRTVAE